MNYLIQNSYKLYSFVRQINYCNELKNKINDILLDVINILKVLDDESTIIRDSTTEIENRIIDKSYELIELLDFFLQYPKFKKHYGKTVKKIKKAINDLQCYQKDKNCNLLKKILVKWYKENFFMEINSIYPLDESHYSACEKTKYIMFIIINDLKELGF